MPGRPPSRLTRASSTRSFTASMLSSAASGPQGSDGWPPMRQRPASLWVLMPCGTLPGMTEADPKTDLHRYLRGAREALLWKLDRLSEYDIRRPLTPTGTNLLGLVKHLAGVAAGYFGETFGRPFGEAMSWLDDDAEPNADMWAPADESREEIVGMYDLACAHW